jgi:hypothetical protein
MAMLLFAHNLQLYSSYRLRSGAHAVEMRVFGMNTCAFLSIITMAATGVIRCESSNGFQGSPEHAALGDVCCIALPQAHGHQNGHQKWCIFCHCQVFAIHNCS